MATAKSESNRSGQGRGAVFPSMGLRKAIHRAEQLEAAEKRNLVRMTRMAEIWEYSAKSSGLRQTVASLRSYGLLDFQGVGADRQARISDRAYRIIHDAPDAAHQRHEAALSAPLHKELWLHYRQNWPPSDENIRDYLAFELEKMDAKAALGAGRRFKETIKYADLDNSNDSGDNDKDNDKNNIQTDWIDPFKSMFTLPKAKSVPPPGRPVMRKEVTTIGDHEAAISWPARMTAEDFEDFEYWLKGVISKSGRAARASASEDEEKKTIQE